MSLSAFLAENAVPVENIKFVASKRFLGEDGNPIPWEIKTITGTEDEALRKSCAKRVPVPGKKNQYQKETDYDLYLGKLAVACTVFPNLNDKELQDSYKVMGADALLKTMLTPGEYAEYLTKIQEVCAFRRSTCAGRNFRSTMAASFCWTGRITTMGRSSHCRRPSACGSAFGAVTGTPRRATGS